MAADALVPEPPFISIIVPIYNEEAYIKRCADALLGQDYPSDRFEILMVDNNSTDRSAEIARGIAGLRVFSEPEQGDFAARNRGIAESRGEILAFTDSDTAPHPDWLKQIASVLEERPEVGVIIGRLRFVGSSRTLALLAAYEEDKAEHIFNSDDPTVYYGYTCNLAARRSLFDELGPFAPVQRNADVVFVRSVVDARSTDSVIYSRDVAVDRLEIRTPLDYFGKQAIYGRDFPRYGKIANARPLRMDERFSIFRRVLQKRKHAWLDAIVLFLALAVGAVCYDVARWLSREGEAGRG